MTPGNLVRRITRRKLLGGSAAAFLATFLPPIAGSKRVSAGSCCGTCCCVNYVGVWCYCDGCDCLFFTIDGQTRFCVTEDWCCTSGCGECFQNPGYCLIYCNQCFQACPEGYSCNMQFVSTCFSLQCKAMCA